MKQAKRIVAMVLCLLVLLALPAGAVMEKGEPNITAQTTMKEVRNNPGIKNSGFYTYSQDKDCPPGQALWEMTTVEGYTNEYVAEGCAKGLNLVIENYNNGVQVTHSFYTDAEKAADRTKNNTGLFYFPAKAENAKFALILAGSGANESAELEEGACTAWQLMALACVQELGFGADRLNRLYAEMRHNYEQLNEWGKTDGLDVAMEKLRRCACDALQTEDIVVENVDDEKTVQTLSRSYKEQEVEFLKRAVMMAAGRKACRQSLNVLNEESVRQKCADAMAAATGSNLSPLRSGYASALQSSPDMGAKDQGGR